MNSFYAATHVSPCHSVRAEAVQNRLFEVGELSEVGIDVEGVPVAAQPVQGGLY